MAIRQYTTQPHSIGANMKKTYGGYAFSNKGNLYV